MGVVAESVVEQGRLRELVVIVCPVGSDDGPGHLAAMLERNRSMLVVTGCKIGDAGLERLGRALTRNTTLRQLDVRYNNVTPEGAARFADMMGDMHGLHMLNLDGHW